MDYDREIFEQLAESVTAEVGETKAVREELAWQAKIAALLDGCHPKQLAFVLDDSKRIAALTGGRCGKTTGGRVRLLRRAMLTKRARCLFIAETRPHAEELVWLPIKDLCDRLEIDAKFDETRLVCTLRKNGAQIKLVGADDKREINKLRGVPRHEVGIDEGASHPVALLEQLIDRVLAPRLGDYDGTLWVVGTPGHILSGRFYDSTRPGSEISRPYEDKDDPQYEGWVGWSFHQWSMLDAAEHVPQIATAWKNALLTKRRNGWEDENPVWKREYLGLWAADDTENVFKYRPHDDKGKPLNQYAPKMLQRGSVPGGFADLPDGNWLYVYGMDMGHSDPFALVVLAHNADTNELRHVYEFTKKGMFVRDIAKLLMGHSWCEAMNRQEDPGSPGGIIGVTGWPFAIACDATNLGNAIIEELREVYGIPVEKAMQKDKHDAVEIVNGDLIDGRLKILKGSKLEEQMLSLQWAVDDVGRLKENKGQANHLTDALIYARRSAKHLSGTPRPPVEEEKPKRRPEPPMKRYLLADPVDEYGGHDFAAVDFSDEFGDYGW